MFNTRIYLKWSVTESGKLTYWCTFLILQPKYDYNIVKPTYNTTKPIVINKCNNVILDIDANCYPSLYFIILKHQIKKKCFI